jgi:3D (Asp-Asp-Asp) domain-containing protein
MNKHLIERIIFLSLLIVCGIALVISGLEADAMQAEIQELRRANERKEAQLKDKQFQIDIQDMLLDLQDELIDTYINEMAPSLSQTSLGDYTITAYCGCEICCGEYALNRPNNKVYGAAGIELTEGISVASPLPLGTKIIINGKEYINHDRTAEWIVNRYNGKIIDIYFEKHEDAESFGKQVYEVFLVAEGEVNNWKNF